jgi:hypothetical protein
MREVLGEIDLLEFIEDELSPAQAAAVRERLSREPLVLARLERMRQDRAMLAADALPIPAFDLVAELEPLLAKPMLLGASPVTQVRPGVYRARHRRSFARRWRSLAMAAGFVVVSGSAALWGLIELTGQGAAGNRDLAMNGSGEFIDRGTDLAEPGASESPAALDGEIHHWLPSRDAIALVDRSGHPDEVELESPLTRIALRSGAEAIESPVALMVRGEQRADLLERLAAVLDSATSVTDSSGRGALVRNFTLEEVEAAWREMVASSGLPRQEDLIASIDGAGFHALSTQQRETIHRVARHTTISLGEHLAGDAANAATADQQLRFVEAGAGHAITMPAREIVMLMESLSAEFGEAISLHTLGDSTAPGTSNDPLAAWREWRDAIGALKATLNGNHDAMIVLPVGMDAGD